MEKDEQYLEPSDGGFTLDNPTWDQVVYMRRYRFVDVTDANPELRPGTIQQWINRGFFQLADANPGAGYRRRFNLAEICCVALVPILSEYGISAKTAIQFFGDAVPSRLKDLLIEKAEAGSRCLLFVPKDGGGWEKALIPQDEPLSIPVNGCLVVPIDQVIFRALERLGERDIFIAKSIRVRT